MCQAEHADGDVLFARIPRLFHDSARDKIFARAVGFDDGVDDVFGNIPVIGEQLFCILGQAITAVPERRIVVPVADARVEANSVDDRLCIQTARFGIGVKLVEICDSQSQISVGEQFDSFSFCRPHD